MDKNGMKQLTFLPISPLKGEMLTTCPESRETEG